MKINWLESNVFRYFFPTYEDGAVLCQLKDAGEDSETSRYVIPEYNAISRI